MLPWTFLVYPRVWILLLQPSSRCNTNSLYFFSALFLWPKTQPVLGPEFACLEFRALTFVNMRATLKSSSMCLVLARVEMQRISLSSVSAVWGYCQGMSRQAVKERESALNIEHLGHGIDGEYERHFISQNAHHNNINQAMPHISGGQKILLFQTGSFSVCECHWNRMSADA